MDCNKCVFKMDNTGSHHVACTIPTLANIPEVGFLSEVMARAHQEHISIGGVIVINGHGVRNGWAMYPLNFDPIWIEQCNFYKEKEQENG